MILILDRNALNESARDIRAIDVTCWNMQKQYDQLIPLANAILFATWEEGKYRVKILKNRFSASLGLFEFDSKRDFLRSDHTQQLFMDSLSNEGENQ